MNTDIDDDGEDVGENEEVALHVTNGRLKELLCIPNQPTALFRLDGAICRPVQIYQGNQPSHIPTNQQTN